MKSSRCGYCGRQLPRNAPEGLCPSCLLKLAAAELGTRLEVQNVECRVQNEAAQPGSPRLIDAAHKAETDAQKPNARVGKLEAGGAPASPHATGHSSLGGKRLFGGYELLEKIGEGGMGVVYKARQLNLDRQVALKLLPFGQFSREDLVKRFRAEATAAASLQHPNIVAIYDFGEHEGQQYFSMELVPGQTLGELVRDQPLPSKRATAYLKTIAEAVHYAHQHSILHRDLKPSNIIIDGSDQPRITDFGLAKRLTDSQLATLNSQPTLTGQVLGSPNFMSPEQAGGHAQLVGPASDIYSLGALLYHLLTRQPPFQADTITTLLKQVVEAEPVPPRLLNPSIPRDLETICLKCLEKEPACRYQTSQALAEDLSRFLEDKPILARPVSATGKAWKWCRRRPAVAGVMAALVLTFVLGFGGIVWQWSRARQNAQAELQQRERAQAGEEAARHNAYAADMRLAQLAIAENNRALAASLLDKYRPAFAQPSTRNSQPLTDLRGWEWRYLWQLCQGDERFTLQQYRTPVKALGISKDGGTLAVATDNEVVLWDLNMKQPLATLFRGQISTLALSPTDKLLAIAPWAEKEPPPAQLWEVTAGVATRKLDLEASGHCLAFSPDGDRLAILNVQGKLTIADCADGRTLARFDLQRQRYGDAGVVIFLADGDHLAIGQEYGKLQLLDLTTRTFTPLETDTGFLISALAYSAATGLLAAGVGYSDGTIQLWDVRSTNLVCQLTNHTDEITALAFTADGRQLISASHDWTTRIWNVAERSQLRCLQSAREALVALALLPQGGFITGGSGGSVCFWNPANSSRQVIHTNLALSLGLKAMRDVPPERWVLGNNLDPKTVERFGLAFTPDSRRFITLDTNGTLVRYDARSWQLLETLPAMGSNHWGVALSPDGRWLATGDHPGGITLWDWTTQQAVTNFTVPLEWFGLMWFSRTGRYFMADAVLNDSTHRVRIWRTNGWLEVPLTSRQFEGLWPIDLSPDERLLAAGYLNGAIKLFGFPSLDHVTSLPADPNSVSGVLFSPDGRQLVSVDFGGQVRLWDIVAGRELGQSMRGHLGLIMGAALSPDGRRLASGGPTARDAVKLWDLVARREVLSLEGEGIFFTHLVFSPDGNTLAATALSGHAHLWRAPSWEEIAAEEKGRRSNEWLQKEFLRK